MERQGLEMRCFVWVIALQRIESISERDKYSLPTSEGSR